MFSDQVLKVLAIERPNFRVPQWAALGRVKRPAAQRD